MCAFVYRFHRGNAHDAAPARRDETGLMRDSRREAMIRAAEGREKSWGKRVAGASVARKKRVHMYNKFIMLSD